MKKTDEQRTLNAIDVAILTKEHSKNTRGTIELRSAQLVTWASFLPCFLACFRRFLIQMRDYLCKQTEDACQKSSWCQNYSNSSHISQISLFAFALLFFCFFDCFGFWLRRLLHWNSSLNTELVLLIRINHKSILYSCMIQPVSVYIQSISIFEV